MPERLGRSDDLRPLEKDGILWDQLILRDYVHFCVQEPLYSGEGPENPKELESAAVNPPAAADSPPGAGQDRGRISGQGQGNDFLSQQESQQKVPGAVGHQGHKACEGELNTWGRTLRSCI